MQENLSSLARAWTMTRALPVRPHPTPDTTHAPFVADAAASVPSRFNLLDKTGAIVDQLTEGSCSTNAGVGWRAYGRNAAGYGWQAYSRNGLYWFERMILGTTATDSGATVPVTIQALEQYGVILESLWGYGPQTLFTAPPASLMANALKLDPQQVQYLGQRLKARDVVAAIAAGKPVIFGLYVYPDLMPSMIPGNALAYSGLMAMPDAQANERLGGHEIFAVGYDLTMGSGYVLCRNSWSAEWALSGYFWMPLQYLEAYAFDGYCIGPDSPAASRSPQVFAVPNLSPRALPPKDQPQAPWPNPLPPAWQGSVTATITPDIGIIGAGTEIQAHAFTSGALPADQRVWLGAYQHLAPFDNLELAGWFWWQEMQSQDRRNWSATYRPEHDDALPGYHGYVVRVLPASITPDRHGDPGYVTMSEPYPEWQSASAPTVTGAAPVVVPPLAPEVMAIAPMAATPQAKVTVTGTGFDASVSFAFGSAIAQAVIISPQQAVLTVPASSGVVDVTAASSAGMSATGPATKFTFEEAAPVPTVQKEPVFVQGKQQTFEAVILDGQALVPAVLYAEALGATATRSAKGVEVTLPKA